MLNKLALLMDQPPKKIKKVWNDTPKPKRSKNRDQIWRLLSKHDEAVRQKQDDVEVRKEKAREQFLKFVQPYRKVEEETKEKARKLKMKRKNRAQREAMGFSFLGGILGWVGGIFK
jgi:hypothetical protein